MDLIVALIITFLLLLASVFQGIFLAYPLAAIVVLFFLLAVRRGFPAKEVLRMAYGGAQKSYVVIRVLLLIGALLPLWTAAGTVPAVVYWGTELVQPNLFILFCFLICCGVSFLIGTSVGTSGVVGVALMVMAKSGDVNLHITAGAIIAGAFFGDRCSPVSSSAAFVAAVTETNIYDNIRDMLKTGVVPFVLAAAFYAAISPLFASQGRASGVHELIPGEFNLHWIVLLPAVIIIVLALLRTDIKIAMALSILSALILSIALQHQNAGDLLRFTVFGFQLDDANPLHTIITSSGLIALLKTSLVVFFASAFAGIVEGASMLNKIESLTEKAESRAALFGNMSLSSLFGAMIGCSQTFAVMLTYILNKNAYEKNGFDKSAMAVDLENTAIMISALIPWNIALLAPMAILDVGPACIPYMVYIYLIPLWNFLYLVVKERAWRTRASKTSS